MCYYITASLPKGSKLENLTLILKNYNMSFEEIDNKNIKTQLREGDLYLRATKAYCDCNSVLGSENQTQEYKSLLNSKKVKNLRKMKWTEEQIDNWIKEKLGKKDKNKLKTLTEHEKKIEIERWLNFIRAIIKEAQILRLGIMKHWYSHNLEKEEFEIKAVQKVNLKNLNNNLILRLEEDTLYEFY
ncbi:MAG: hypothetical protein ACFFA8_02445 [Promethearchaeota archaeon]